MRHIGRVRHYGDDCPESPTDFPGLQPLIHQGDDTSHTNAIDMRNNIKLFVNKEGARSWQHNHI